MAGTFSLAHDPWIPVQLESGGFCDLSLSAALTRPDVRALASADPIERFALYTPLLAARIRADRATGGDVAAYLDTHADGLVLVADGGPGAFMQPPTSREPKTIAALRHDWSSGNNATLFSHHTDANPPRLTYAEAARALVGYHLWAMGAGAGYRPGVLARKTLIWLDGGSLPDSLRLNAERWAGATGTPSWETEPERGALYDLTAPSSRAQLVPDGEGTVSLVRLEGMRTDPSGDPLPLAHEIATWNRPTLWAQFPDLRRAAGAVRFEVAQDRVMAGKAKREEVRWGDFRPPGVVDEDVVGAVWSYASGCSRALYLGLRTYLDEMGARDQSVPGALARRWWRAAEPHLMAVVGTGAAPDVADTEIRALRRAMVALYDSEAGASGSRQLRAAALGRDRLRVRYPDFVGASA